MEDIKQEFYTPDEVAELLRVKKLTLANWRNKGKGPKYIKIGNMVRYLIDDVKEFMKGNR